MLIIAALFAAALQSPATTIHVVVRTAAAPVDGADVVVLGRTYRTGADGAVTIDVAAGTFEVTVAKEDFVPVTTHVTVNAGQTQDVLVDLAPEPSFEERVTVSATRTERRLADEPTRVEVLDKEDLEEEQAQTPGDITMVLNEKAGVRAQTSSPGLGTASVRIQGMRGRYTRVLSDGLPIFGEDVGGIGLLQTPPTDLAQIELIKGVASALYGAGALGGVIDLISKRPGATPERQVLLNRSSHGATDAVLFASEPLTDRWSGSVIVGGHFQELDDVDSDGWADLPHYSRGIVRPRVYWDDHHGDTLFATAGVTWEHRTGGTIDGAVLPTTNAPYVEGLDTARVDGGFVSQTLVAQKYVLTARGSMTTQRQDHRFGEIGERDRTDTFFGEVSIRGQAPRQTWVAGGAFERDTFTPTALEQFAYTYNVPGVFAQDDVDVAPWLVVSASARVDAHDQFGTFVSPRLSALLRGGGWTSRFAAGSGFYAPTPFTDETEAAGLTRLTIPTPLRPERGRSYSWDVGRTIGPVSLNATAFHSVVDDAMVLDRERYVLLNSPAPTTNTGAELFAVYHDDPFSVSGVYTYVHAIEGAGADRGDIPLTPRQSIGVFGVWEKESTGRVALEWYYTGRQRLEDNPYRSTSEPYIVFGGLIERRLRHLRLFLNAENLGNVKQTDWDPLIRPTRAIDGRWTVDAWAPLDGRVVNGGVRIAF